MAEYSIKSTKIYTIVQHAITHYKAASNLLNKSFMLSFDPQSSAESSYLGATNFAYLYNTMRGNKSLSKALNAVKSINTSGSNLEDAIENLGKGLSIAFNELYQLSDDDKLSDRQNEALNHLTKTGDSDTLSSKIDFNKFSKIIVSNAKSGTYNPHLHNIYANKFASVTSNKFESEFTEQCRFEFDWQYPGVDVCTKDYINFVKSFFEDIGQYSNIHSEL